MEAVMEREREGNLSDQTAARRRAAGGGLNGQRTARIPRTPSASTAGAPSLPRTPSIPRMPSYPPTSSMPRAPRDSQDRRSSSAPRGVTLGDSQTSPGASRSGSFSRPRNSLVPRATRQIPALDEYDSYRDGLPDLHQTSASGRTALTPYTSQREEAPAPVILAPSPTRSLSATITPRREPTIKPWMRLTAGLIAIAACIAGVLGFQLIHPAALGDRVNGVNSANSGVPAPSGRGPISATIAVIIAMPPPQAQHNSKTQYSNGPTYNGSLVAYGLISIQPCHDAYQFVPNISQWTVPPGCYANVYRPNPANYPVRASWGWCNWWVEETHPQDPNVTGATSYPRGTAPIANAAVFIDGGEQGASSAGHWAESVAVSPGGYWVLISEMNFAWRGAGWGLIDYRYIHVSPHVHFLYGV
jgi:hypothetical protein